MESLHADILALLIAFGPLLVFGVALLETALFIGLLVPAEATVLLAAFLAERGVFEPEHVLAAAFFGGLAGDQIGYLLGRHGGRRMVAKGGAVGRLWARYERVAERLFRRHSVLGITFARFLSFVRTLMPWFAGMTGISYPRFLFYDLLGVFGWAAGSVALGYAAGGSLTLVEEWLGQATALVIGLSALAWLMLSFRRRLSRRRL